MMHFILAVAAHWRKRDYAIQASAMIPPSGWSIWSCDYWPFDQDLKGNP
jgi:hypothetical protein